MSHTITKCPHCSQMMRVNNAIWQYCSPCGFWSTYDDGSGNGWHFKYECYVGDWACALNLYPDDDKSVITAIHKKFMNSNLDDHEHPATRIPINHCIKNITPQNVIDKIKLILLYQ